MTRPDHIRYCAAQAAICLEATCDESLSAVERLGAQIVSVTGDRGMGDGEGMTFGSLFAGIGGFDLGLERAGMTCRWQVEIDPFCRKVLEKHWPNVPKYGDITKLTGDELERVDLLAGGFPCQDLSCAGKRAGIDGERSGLWREYARLIGHLRPRYVLIENVPGLLANEPMRRVLGDLSSLGFDAEWQSLPASAFGAPHIRYRVFIVAYCDRRGFQISRECYGHKTQSQFKTSQRNDPDGFHPNVANSGGRRCHRQEARKVQQPRRAEAIRTSEDLSDSYGCNEHWRAGDVQVGRLWGAGQVTGDGLTGRDEWRTEPAVGRVAHGVPNRLERLRGLGNAIVPQVAEWIGRRVLEATA